MESTSVEPTPIPASSGAPDAAELARRLFPEDTTAQGANQKIAQLHELLTDVPAQRDLEERTGWIEKAVLWIKDADRQAPTGGRGTLSRGDRLRLLLDAVDGEPQWRDEVSALLWTTLREMTGVRLFAETGMPSSDNFVSEALWRGLHQVLPVATDADDLAELVQRLFPSERDAQWLADLSPALIARLVARVADGAETDEPLIVDDVLDALHLLAGRASGLAFDDDVRVRGSGQPIRQSPFAHLPHHIEQLTDVLDGRHSYLDIAEVRSDLAACVAGCRGELQAVVGHLDSFGVSVGLVYKLERIRHTLDRIDHLAELLAGEEFSLAMTRSLSRLVHAQIHDQSLRALFRTNLHQLSRKIVESASKTGGHYITATRSEYFAMLKSAAGGGFLTAGTTWAKFAIASASLPLFVSGFFATVNYAGSFLLMQSMHMTLATKQPSMTAATLAASIKSADADRSELVDQIVNTARSQFAAAVGNLGVVIPTVLLLSLMIMWTTGAPLLDEETARYAIDSLHPTKSGTIPFAILTGFVLWFSSVCAGWAQNWVIYRRFGEAVRSSRRIARWLGPRATTWVSEMLERNIAGIANNLALGFLLAVVPLTGIVLGLPIDVRHVTLSTGALTFGVHTLGVEVFRDPMFYGAIAGILIIGILNFGVSFWLALLVAMRSHSAGEADEQRRLWRSVLVRLVSRPREFFLPPRS